MRGINFVKRKLKDFFAAYERIASPQPHKDNLSNLLHVLSKGRIDLLYSAYFNTIFDLKKLDIEVIDKLKNTISTGDEGYLLEPAVNDLRVCTQVNYLALIIKKIKPKRVLETGTHNAMFCYLAHLCDNSITIDTFGDLPESQKAVDILNNKYGAYICYYLGDSRQTLGKFSPDYQIDFAWVDGGHSFEVCSSDLMNCARLKIPSIAVDDYKWIDDIKKSVDEFIKRYNYSIESASNLADCRGIVHLVKR